MKKNRIRLTESQLHRVIKESVKKVLRETNDFKPTRYRTVSNLGGYEIEIDPSGDMARFRFYDEEPTDWMEIKYDRNGVAYVNPNRSLEILIPWLCL